MVKYKVIGECEVAGVAPGGIVTTEQLEKHRALVGPLLGAHLEEVPDAPVDKLDPKKTLK